MNTKLPIFSSMIIISMLLISLPAKAVSPHSSWNAFRNNTIGTTTIVLPPHASKFCFLSKVNVQETDTGGESAQCRVRRSGTVWLLEATLGSSSDADVSCSAECFNN